jgi:hypothetical protein
VGPTNGIIGDDSLNPDTVPQPVASSEDGTAELKAAAAFAQSPHFQELKERLAQRADFYTKYLPNGQNVLASEDPTQTGQMWMVANAIIGEFNMLVNSYELAAQQLKELNSNARREV